MHTKRFFTFILFLTYLISVDAQILFRVEGNGLSNPSYLFGTHHFAPLSILDSVPQTRKALMDVEKVVGEIEMLNLSPLQMAAQMQPYMQAPPDSTLSKLLSEAQFSEASEKFQAVTGMHIDMMEKMRPAVPQMVVVALLANKYFGDKAPQTQIDTWMQQSAADLGKQTGGLETIKEQAEILYTFTPLTVQAQNLLKILEEPTEAFEEVEKLTEAYMNRDLNLMYTLSRQENQTAEDKAFIDALLVSRNEKWLSEMPTIMKEMPTLFVVGALHLAGEHGLVQRLRELNYTVTPIP